MWKAADFCDHIIAALLGTGGHSSSRYHTARHIWYVAVVHSRVGCVSSYEGENWQDPQGRGNREWVVFPGYSPALPVHAGGLWEKAGRVWTTSQWFWFLFALYERVSLFRSFVESSLYSFFKEP